jgi:FkbM family methyltransferase
VDLDFTFRNDDDRRTWEGVYANLDYEVPDSFEPGDTVLDLGAHIGCFARLCAERGACVIAAEPAEDNIRVFRLNTEPQKGRIMLVSRAVVPPGHPRMTWLVHCPVPGGFSGHTLVLHPDKGDSEEVPTITLDELIELAGPKIRFCKMNIEGSEYEVLRTATLLGRIQTLMVQFHNVSGENPEDGRAWLQAQGFVEDRWDVQLSHDDHVTPNFWNFRGTRK